MSTPALKEKELRRHAVCGHCGRKIGETKLPIFYLVTVERHGIDMQALQRQQGLGMMLGGNGLLAMHMGANEDMTIPLMEKATVMICEECSTLDLCVAQLAEYAIREVNTLPVESPTPSPAVPGQDH